MARKTAAVKGSSSSKPGAAKGTAKSSKVASSTPVRNSAIPKVTSAAMIPAPAKREITREMIAVRAFEISMGSSGGSEFDNWLRAERELRAGV